MFGEHVNNMLLKIDEQNNQIQVFEATLQSHSETDRSANTLNTVIFIFTIELLCRNLFRI